MAGMRFACRDLTMKAHDFSDRGVGRDFEAEPTLKRPWNDFVTGRSSRNTYFCSVLFATLMMISLAAIQPWIDPRWLFLDGQTVGEMSGDCCHVYDGAFSMLGIMLWASTAALASFSAIIFQQLYQRVDAKFALQAMLLSSILAIDDAYLLHEIVLPKLGLPQELVLLGIGILTLTYLVANARRLIRSNPWLLIFSLSAFVFSVAIDQVFHSLDPVFVVFEDGAKLMGIVAWFLFHLNAFSDTLISGLRNAKTRVSVDGYSSNT